MSDKLPNGITEEDLQEIMQSEGVSREEAIGAALYMHGYVEHTKRSRSGYTEEEIKAE